MLKLQKITATINVLDLKRSVDFYISLGFTQDWLWPESKPVQASLSNNGVSFMVKQVTTKAEIHTTDLYFSVEGIGGFYDGVQPNITDCPELVVQPYGMQDFTITDPDGHTMSFGEPSGEYSES